MRMFFWNCRYIIFFIGDNLVNIIENFDLNCIICGNGNGMYLNIFRDCLIVIVLWIRVIDEYKRGIDYDMFFNVSWEVC